MADEEGFPGGINDPGCGRVELVGRPGWGESRHVFLQLARSGVSVDDRPWNISCARR